MKQYFLFFLISFICINGFALKNDSLTFFKANHQAIRYTGRIDFSNKTLPRFWQPGVYIDLKFKGEKCGIVLNDEVLWGTNNNYVELVLDGKPSRRQLRGNCDTLWLEKLNPTGNHFVTIVKNTEANIGYLEFAGIICNALLPLPPKPWLKMEFIGNSITCGTGSDQSAVACGKGQWYDQHNAYLSYGAITAMKLNASYHLSSVSGIGLMHSCCDLKITMPAMFDKINLYNGTQKWDFGLYQPDIVTVCLGQNDGIQDSATFSTNYIRFIKQLRAVYPRASFICLSSPMADGALKAFMVSVITALVDKLKAAGEQKLSCYFFKNSYQAGCDKHPSLQEHEWIANELIDFINQDKQFQL